MDKNKVQNFLKHIAQIESASGKNTNHALITYGMHKGDRAIGTYGLMPKTVDEIAERSNDPELKKLKGLPAEEKHRLIQTGSDLEHRLAATLAEHVLQRQGGDEQKAAYSWLHGHNLSPEAIAKRDYTSHDYVKKYNKLSGLLNRAPAAPAAPSEEAVAEREPSGANPLAGTLEQNAAQKEQIKQAIAERLAATDLGVPDAISLPTMSSTAPEEEVEPNMEAIRMGAPVRHPARKPQFNAINNLIAQYQAKGGPARGKI